MLEKQGHVQFGLLRTFNSPALFRMDQDSLGEIRSPEALFDYLKEISAASRKLLPRSSDYMSEEVILPVFLPRAHVANHEMSVDAAGQRDQGGRGREIVPAKGRNHERCRNCAAYRQPVLLHRRLGAAVPGLRL